jgi:hypothetical protein
MQTPAPAYRPAPPPAFWKHPLFIILAVIFPVVLIVGRIIHAPVDDSYIFYVYARSFVEGAGLTFNGLNVEGYSSLLWMFGISGLSLTGLPIPLVGEALSTAAGLFTLLMTYRLARRAGLGSYTALIPVGLLAASGDFVFYASVGMETVLFAGLIALAAAESLTDDLRGLLTGWRFPLILALMILTRPEGALVAGVLLCVLWARTGSLWLSVRCGLVLTAMLVPFFAFRYFYYGDLLPNTWYAKGNAGLANLRHGLAYFIVHLIVYAPLPIMMSASVILLTLRRRPIFSVGVVTAGTMALAYVVYIVMVGGDNMVAGRVWVPVLPLIFVVLARWNAQLFRPPPQVFMAVLVAAYVIGLWYGNPSLQERLAFEDTRNEARRQIGLYLRENFPPDTVVALNAAGTIPFYSGLPTIDMLGLNDRYLAHYGKRDFTLAYAHQVGDGTYVLAQEPDVILFGPDASREPPDPSYLGDHEIWDSAEFQANYEPYDFNGYGWGWVRR